MPTHRIDPAPFTNERTRSSRVFADFEVHFERHGGVRRTGRAVDLSPTGMFVETSAPPPRGARITLELYCDPEGFGPLVIEAKVTRIGVAWRAVPHPTIDHLTLAAHGFACRFLGVTPPAVARVYEAHDAAQDD